MFAEKLKEALEAEGYSGVTLSKTDEKETVTETLIEDGEDSVKLSVDVETDGYWQTVKTSIKRGDEEIYSSINHVETDNDGDCQEALAATLITECSYWTE
jgi:hypothetical protein